MDKKFKQDLESTLDAHFPKGKSSERSSGLMLYASAVLEHEKVMDLVRKYLGLLLGVGARRGSPEWQEAEDFYERITKD
jgi:hypothetical protein